jgi:4-hydroxybenzoate polyprenyltransferase
MGALATPRLMGWKTALKLGRVSNLPTVWSNVIAALALAGGAPLRVVLAAAAAMSLLYIGGMYLNDAFDRDIDARERGSRPIPSGEASANTVFGMGFAALAAGVLLLAVQSPRAGLVGLVVAGVIVLYDWHHKGNL